MKAPGLHELSPQKRSRLFFFENFGTSAMKFGFPPVALGKVIIFSLGTNRPQIDRAVRTNNTNLIHHYWVAKNVPTTFFPGIGDRRHVAVSRLEYFSDSRIDQNTEGGSGKSASCGSKLKVTLL